MLDRSLLSPVRGGVKLGAELIGGGMRLDPVDSVLLADEESVELEDGRGVAAAARIASVAVQAIGILTDANAAPA